MRNYSKIVLLVSLFGAATAACGGAPKTERLSGPDAGASSSDTGPADTGRPTPDSGTRPDAGRREDAGARRDSGVQDSGTPPEELLERLKSIDGLAVEEVGAALPGTRAFLLKLRQPENHRQPDGKSFDQRLVLIHRDEREPMVLATTGYGLFGPPQIWTEIQAEPTSALNANQLVVEHRFFGESIASEPTWGFLNIEQSANDSHRIVELLSSIYVGPWVGTGVSKGGMTAIFHHRFFPDDLAAIVPYVAPISFGDDARYLAWVAQLGPADGVCRARVRNMAIELIERRAELADYFIANDPQTAPYQRAVIEAVLTYPAFGWHWSFWQGYGSPEACAALPAADAAIEGLAGWFPFDPAYLTGSDFDPELTPYSYQVANELGSQQIDYSYIEAAASQVDYSVLPPSNWNPPWGMDPIFDPNAMLAVDDYLRNEARHVLGIYGAWDPWTGGIITVDEANDSKTFIVPEIGHAAEMFMLPERQQVDALDRLNRWIGRSMLVSDHRAATQRIADHRADQRWWAEQARKLDQKLLKLRK